MILVETYIYIGRTKNLFYYFVDCVIFSTGSTRDRENLLTYSVY